MMTKSDLFFNVVKFPAKIYYNSIFKIRVTKNELGNDKEPMFFIGNHVAAHDSQISILYSNKSCHLKMKEKQFLDLIPIQSVI